MKKMALNLLTFITVAAVLVILLLSFGTDEGTRYVHKGNTTFEPVNVKSGQYQCSECSMDIENIRYMAQLITKEGDTYFFDDIGCLVLWMQSHHPNSPKILTQTQDTHRWIEVKRARYTRTADSPMGYGFAAFEEQKEGLISYQAMRILMLQGKHLHDPFVKKSLLP